MNNSGSMATCFLYLTLITLGGLDAEPARKQSLASLFGRENQPRTSLHGLDVLALPEEEVDLTTRVDRLGSDGFRHPVSRETVHYFLGCSRIGEARTSDSGIAVLRYRAGMPGDSVIRLSLSRRGPPPSATFPILLRVAKPVTEFLVSDIEKTLHGLNSLRFPFTPNKDIPPFENSAETLQALARSRSILYFSAGDPASAWKVRDWLARYGYPVAPVLYGNLPADQAEAARQKTLFLKKLRSQFPNLLGGIGNRRADAIAFQDNRMASFLICRQREENLPTGTHVYATWKELRAVLLPE